jgi:hypothetical protein
MLVPDVAYVYCWYVFTASMGCSSVLTHAADSAEAMADLHPSIHAADDDEEEEDDDDEAWRTTDSCRLVGVRAVDLNA